MQDVYEISVMDAELAGTPFAGKLHYFPTVHSTNAYALEQAQAGAETHSVYFADEQTAGRGRGGHSWHSSVGDGLYVSVLLRPRLTLTDALWISLATGLAVREAIRNVTGMVADIRWPNDVLLHRHKCCGILAETSASNGADSATTLRHVVVGIGINVNHESFPPEIAALATSLRIESGRSWRRQELLVALLQALHHEVELLEAEIAGTREDAGLLERFTQASTWVRGKQVRVEEAGGYTGVTDGLDARGFLQVRTDDGIRTVLSGGVRELE
ncbi:MAG: biotin--[acetyl-CoA-carboxylase] ligase [Acidobacteriaceae bacterium]